MADEHAQGMLDPVTLAALVSRQLPSGWTIAVNGSRVAIEREEPVEFYNAIAMPSNDRRDEIRRRTRREQLLISLWLGARIDQVGYERMANANRISLEKARQDTKRFKFIPDEEFWRQHSEYGYKELPSFLTEKQSIYLQSTPRGTVFVGRKVPGTYLYKFVDRKVESECQGVVDNLGNLFQTYSQPAKKRSSGRDPD